MTVRKKEVVKPIEEEDKIDEEEKKDKSEVQPVEPERKLDEEETKDQNENKSEVVEPE